MLDQMIQKIKDSDLINDPSLKLLNNDLELAKPSNYFLKYDYFINLYYK